MATDCKNASMEDIIAIQMIRFTGPGLGQWCPDQEQPLCQARPLLLALLSWWLLGNHM
jgi:hypothetical protein